MYENFSTIQTANNGQMFRGYFRFIISCVNFMKIARAQWVAQFESEVRLR